ncbi:MAG: deoxyribodipyrimidine photolyase [Planctomycetes bacterium]|nr:deoxyribodipyrimidine photolyase [Planctomycetota bacterium]
MSSIQAPRLRSVNDRPEQKDGAFVLYWMTAARRPGWNFALQRAVRVAERKELPLVVLEGLRAGYRWASPRHHAFVLQGMRDHAEHFAARGVRYLPYVEPAPGAGRGLLAALAKRAALVVADDWPCFFLPRMLTRAAAELDVRVEAVDAAGIVPFRVPETTFPTAYAFRRWLQKHLRPYFDEPPLADPLDGVRLPRADALPRGVESRWPLASPALLAAEPAELARLPLDRAVAPVAREGGFVAGRRALADFVRRRLPRYAEERSEPAGDASSGLSPWLHYGHVSVHEVLAAVTARERWTPQRLASTTAGKKEGWWNLDASAEAFLDELVTWRELGFNFCARRPDYDRYESLPDWARATLDLHAQDPREHRYTRDELESSATHDPLWNAAQRQLAREGIIHNYLRMLWGKKVLEWSPSPQAALETLIELNNRWAIDGRDPNSYSGIFWVFGRYDRPWAPERKVFGSIRYMSSQNTARKFDVEPYLERYGPST